MKLSLLVALMTIFLTACAGMQSTYKPSDFSGGYGEDKIKENIYFVYFDANGFTPKEVSKKYFLRRASQITLKNGKKCFKVLDEKNTLSVNFMTQNTEAANSSYYYKNAYELIGTEKNKVDDNSISGLIQLSDATTDCLDAQTTLQTSSIE